MFSFGFATDVHYADKNTVDTRYYRDGLPKMEDAAAYWEAAGVDFVYINGDLLDHWGNNSTLALADAADMMTAISGFSGPTYFGLGNHEADALSKAQFMSAVGMSSSYYSFDHGGVHFVVLDGNFSSDSDSDPYATGSYSWNVNYIPPNERTWLADDLAGTDLPVIVFTHYRLSSSGDYFMNNASAVRSILEASGKVIAVFEGHNHINQVTKVNGIHYCCMMAMTEGQYPTTAYALITVREDFTIDVRGRGQQWSFGLR